MKYGVEVLVGPRGKQEWRRMAPTGGPAYEWPTRQEAEDAMRLTYGSPEHRASARVVEIE